ncbi:MAG TPA: RsmE family RNA methyltransferase [Chitinophagaceae bacterium]|jgi:16S rRNA (uracil1498-N3)-methyltransferase
MALPFFYQEAIDPDQTIVDLDGDTSRHVISVLRMKLGDPVHLTDGKGLLLTAEIMEEYKKKCSVRVTASRFIDPRPRKVTIAVSLLKNNHRFEWFLEKATELGVAEIIPLLSERTERQHFRADRMKNMLVSAMLQSQQSWLPVLHEPVAVETLIRQSSQQQKFIAHCIDDEKKNLGDLVDTSLASQVILIGPEGDFTAAEIDLALLQGFVPVTLGDTRLRTETAGVVAATLLMVK